MDSCRQACASNSQRFSFNIEKDINLLESALSVNPFQLGKAKWEDVVRDLNAKYGYFVFARTCRERVEALVKKYKSDELKIKTGTEEQRSRRCTLLQEIISLIEGEEAAIVEEVGAETEAVERTSPNANRINEKVQADAERDNVLKRCYVDGPSEPNKTRTKRMKHCREEEKMERKLEHHMEMQRQQFNLDAEMKFNGFRKEKN